MKMTKIFIKSYEKKNIYMNKLKTIKKSQYFFFIEP